MIPNPVPNPVVLVLMGVSGSGKTTVAEVLASRLGWQFEEGDALHPQANVDKMHAGHPLTDKDRAPWLAKIADWVDIRLDAGQNGLVTCSALKRSYRDLIARRGHGAVFVFLSGERGTIGTRLQARQGHFMPPSLLQSQFETLEPPGADEPVLEMEIGPAPEVIADGIIAALGLAV